MVTVLLEYIDLLINFLYKLGLKRLHILHNRVLFTFNNRVLTNICY